MYGFVKEYYGNLKILLHWKSSGNFVYLHMEYGFCSMFTNADLFFFCEVGLGSVLINN